MPLSTGRYAKRAGLPPGALVYLGEKRVDKASITVIDYSQDNIREASPATLAECIEFINASSVTWINVTGIHDVDIIGEMGDVFGLHPLVLEDIIHTGQRPRIEDHEEYLFIVLKMLYRTENTGTIASEQVSIILGKNYVLTVQEADQDVFGVIRERVRAGKGRIRSMGCDYLAYAILDAIVDNYFTVLEDIGERIESVQQDVSRSAGPETLDRIQRLKREMVFVRRYLWPVREVAGGLHKTESPLFSESLAPYVRDVYEHALHVIDNIEILRDMLSGSLEMYMTIVSNRMNEIMKVLTVIATIFIPLTFVAGIYGMNFDHMPELHWKYGYVGALLVMVAISAGMIALFRRKKWL